MKVFFKKTMAEKIEAEKIGNKILEILSKIITGIEISFSRDSLSNKILRSGGFNIRSINRSFRRYQTSGIVKPVKNVAGRYQLTPKGLGKLFFFSLKNKLDAKFKWDGWWRLIIFDVPENKKYAREALRRKLRYFNFYPIQKSVFATPVDCQPEIESLADFFQISDHVEIISAKSLGKKEDAVRKYYEI
jgi:phenylacetic acid degradation operon negative regulatory protein